MEVWLRVEIIAADNIGEVADEMIRLAKLLGVGVRADFSGTALVAYPKTSRDAILADNERQVEQQVNLGLRRP